MIFTQIYLPEIFKKRTFQPGFCVQNHLLDLCSCAVISQRLFCSQKDGLKRSF